MVWTSITIKKDNPCWQFVFRSGLFPDMFSSSFNPLQNMRFLLLILSFPVITLTLILPVNSHAELSSDDFTLSIDTSEHNNIRVDNLDVIINSQHFTALDSKHQSAEGSPWLKVEWNKTKITDETYIINDFTSQAYEDYYFIKDNEVLASYSGGYVEPTETRRPIKHFKFVAEVNDADYLLVKTCCNPAVPIYFRMLSKDELNEQYHESIRWYSVVYSIIFVILIYNLFIYSYLKEKQYLAYCYYLFSMLVLIIYFSGIGKQFIWTDLPYLPAVYFLFSINASLASMMFQLSFLDKKYLTSFNKKLMYCTLGLHLLLVAFYFVASFIDEFARVLNTLAQMVSLVGLLVTDYVIVRNIIAGDKTARVLLLGYFLINIASVIFLMRYNGYLSNMLWVERSYDTAVVCEALILSLALAQKIQILREEKSRIEEKRLKEQQQFSMQLLTVQEQEKRQIGSALHDNFTHQLLILKNSIKNKLGAQSEESKQVDVILNEMRTLSHLIHPYLLEKLGLKVALTQILNESSNTYNLDINYAIDDIGLNQEQSIIVYRIVQEALNNIIKHANASECVVAISVNNKTVHVLIKDDGDGFDNENKTGFGLSTIAERCQMLGGSHQIQSDENGTEISILFPFNG